MIELRKNDIEALAIHRFQYAHRYKFFGGLLGGLAIMVVLALIIPDSASIWLKIGAFVPLFAGLFYGAYRYLQAQDKAMKAFIAQCEADPELRYRD